MHHSFAFLIPRLYIISVSPWGARWADTAAFAAPCRQLSEEAAAWVPSIETGRVLLGLTSPSTTSAAVVAEKRAGGNAAGVRCSHAQAPAVSGRPRAACQEAPQPRTSSRRKNLARR